MNQRFITRLLLACGVIGPLLFIIVFLIEGATRPGYSAWRHAVSQLSLRERLQDLMDRRHSCLPEVEETKADAVPAKAQGINASRAVQPVTEPRAEPAAEKHYRTIPA